MPMACNRTSLTIQLRRNRTRSGRTLAVRAGVECRIEVAEASDHRLVRLAGRLAEAQVPELIRVCTSSGPELRLDLGNLISVDPVGLEALFQLQQRGVTFLELPAYIQLKLNARTARRPLS